MRQMPKQRRGESKQDYCTPAAFLAAVKTLLGIEAFALDLAASEENAVADRFYTIEDNALIQPWSGFDAGVCFLNPPFSNIRPWVQRAWEQSRRGARIAMLVPAGVGSNWFAEFVHEKALVLLLNGRLTFVGATDPYPKDLCLLLFGPAPYFNPGYRTWAWNQKKAARSTPEKERTHVGTEL